MIVLPSQDTLMTLIAANFTFHTLFRVMLLYMLWTSAFGLMPYTVQAILVYRMPVQGIDKPELAIGLGD